MLGAAQVVSVPNGAVISTTAPIGVGRPHAMGIGMWSGAYVWMGWTRGAE